MNKWFAGTALMLGMLIGYGAAGPTVAAQAWLFPPASGQAVTIHQDPNGGGFACAVIEVRAEFIGCRGTGGQEDWYNLRAVGRIHVAGK